MKIKPISNQEQVLPEYPVVPVDVPSDPPDILQADLLGFRNARQFLAVAQADFERREADIRLRLMYGCRIEPGNLSAFLRDEYGSLVVLDNRRDGRDVHDLGIVRDRRNRGRS